MQLEQIIEQLSISLVHLPSVMGKTKQDYVPWVATTWTPHYEKAEGKTPREAVEALLKLLEITVQ
jgi:hypothetical protein